MVLTQGQQVSPSSPRGLQSTRYELHHSLKTIPGTIHTMRSAMQRVFLPEVVTEVTQ